MAQENVGGLRKSNHVLSCVACNAFHTCRKDAFNVKRERWQTFTFKGLGDHGRTMPACKELDEAEGGHRSRACGIVLQHMSTSRICSLGMNL